MILENLIAEVVAAQKELECLSPQQKEALILTAKGFSDREAAEQMGLRVETVRYHLFHVRERLGMNTVEAAVLAARARWV